MPTRPGRRTGPRFHPPRKDSAFAYRTASAPRWTEEVIGWSCDVLGQAQEYFGDRTSSARLIRNVFFRHIPAHFDPDRDGAGAAGARGRTVDG
ncbi:hypothetical protein ACFWIN_00115 [Streptomyces sp. NPDC127049]|uniref:hypothetical protein n=1 Tax=Streptomyces sp. NPDC127049 TaxID=3347118 RepID=UPI003668BC6A